MNRRQFFPLALALSFATSAAAQNITIGVTLGTTGASASFGTSYKNAFQLMPKTIGGFPVRFIIYEDDAESMKTMPMRRKLPTTHADSSPKIRWMR
jgi:branched-chain amino acid transport system substrate-binding protein